MGNEGMCKMEAERDGMDSEMEVQVKCAIEMCETWEDGDSEMERETRKEGTDRSEPSDTRGKLEEEDEQEG